MTDTIVDFRTEPARYRHWKLSFDGPVATLAMDVQEDAGLRPGYELKLNSYDLGVDIELYDAIQRLRFEHPEVGAVILTSGKERIFCAGANIRMLGQSSHGWKVNFCKFTNETRNAMEEASAESKQVYLTMVNGPCAGGGYELALATEWIVMADDGNTAVSLPEVPLLAVLPGTGGLTRLVDKRRVRRDRADFFCTTEEGVKGKRAVEWGLVDEVVPRSRLAEAVKERARALAAKTDRPRQARGITLTPLRRTLDGDRIAYDHVTCTVDRARGLADITVAGPTALPPADPAGVAAAGAAFWPLALARELDDLILHLRTNEEQIGLWVLRTQGSPELVEAYDRLLLDHGADWLVREVRLYLKRTLKRLDVSSRSVFALIEPGSCFTGTLLELALAADRSYMLDGTLPDDARPAATVKLTGANFGLYPMINGLTRLASRFLGEPGRVDDLKGRMGQELEAAAAAEAGLVTFAPDDIDWEDEVRLALEERAAFSPDALTGMEASLRFGGPETLETKIFGRLTAWQNWIFQRPNAVGPKGALQLYGTGERSDFDRRRV
ncbi:MAG TPA: 2,3-epoxybenzoyl-CoA dihydrolase [Methylomirabilota bacterium]|jgi:benzoyl-CoA-dihydrodiol lyase|nr:2,3-epoxybenzoyl-CoA dihydrolase [Methylomirabilota bacterium]